MGLNITRAGEIRDKVDWTVSLNEASRVIDERGQNWQWRKLDVCEFLTLFASTLKPGLIGNQILKRSISKMF